MVDLIKYIIILCLVSIAQFSYAQCTLAATSSGGNTAYTQVYVLVDAGNNIVAQNTTGIFNAVATGSYQIHALNYDPADVPSPLPGGLVGQPVSGVGSMAAGCFNTDFLTDFVTRVCTDPSCAQTTSICENGSITATSSGGNAAYTQVYVLADDNRNFIDQNGTGIFSTAALVTGNIYQVHALNYDPANPPATIPGDLAAGDPLSDITGGCFNADFLSDFVCFEIISCVCTPSEVCSDASIMATSSGGNASYTQVYVLADDNGDFVAQNSTGTFPANTLVVGSIYQVHALNYDPANPPATVPGDLAAGDPLSDITGGCFNADFLSDFVCFNIIDCLCTPTEACSDASIVATSSGGNTNYIQIYVLADSDGDFVAHNSTGTFPVNALDIGSIYNVHALNYHPANPPATLPSDLAVGDPLSDITGGCFNADFLSDYICFEITCCGGPAGFLR